MSLWRLTSTQRKPAVGLCLDASSSVQLAPLVRALAEFATPVAPERNQVVQARLVSSVHTPTAHLVVDEPHVPAAVVIHHENDLAHSIAEAAAVLVGIGNLEPSSLHDFHSRLISLSPNPLATPFPLPVSVPQRAALRQRFGLGETLVISVGRPGAPMWRPAELATALRVASVVVAGGEEAAMAMALGAPVVTDAFTASQMGAKHLTHVLVAAPHEASQMAEALAHDPKTMAALATKGRQLVKDREPSAVARTLMKRWGISPASVWPSAVNARFGARLAELGTPAGHPIENQFEDRLKGLGMQVQSGGL